MKFLNVTADNQISHGMPIPVFSRFTKALTTAKGRDVPMDSVIDAGQCVIHLEDASRGYKANGGCEALPSGKRGAFLMLDRDATIEFTCPDGDIWYAHNDPFQNEIAVKNEPIIVPERGPDPVTNWLLNGERGASSEAMCQHLFGKKAGYHSNGGRNDYPHDPADFRRCRLFVEATGCRDRIGEMAKVSPIWAMYIKHWDELCEMMDAEVGWMKGDHSGSASNTFAAMMAMQCIVRGDGEGDAQFHSQASGQLEFSSRKANADLPRIIQSRVAMIKALVKYGVNVDARYQPTDSTALANAVSRVVNLTGKLKPHHTAVIEALIECGADVNARTPNTLAGLTIAEYARSSDKADILCRALGISQDPADTQTQPRSRQRVKA